jgi:ABC-2 type transport system ATP-binding protein
MSVPIVQMVDLTKKYGDFTAVNSLNLTIEKGEIFGLLGPNGAGKSTTILMMLGLTEPTSGWVEVCGINSTTNPIEVKKKVGYLPEDVGFYDDLTAMENLVYTARLNGIPENEAKTKAEVLLNRVGLAGEINKKAGKYSKGMRQRLGLADVLIKSPEVIILDEPTSGIDPKGVQEFLKLIVELRNERGINVLFSSHNLHQVQQVCDRVGIFVEGRLLAVGDIESLSRKLFTHGRYLIEVGIDANAQTDIENTGKLANLIQSISGVESVNLKNGIYEIESQHDNSGPIAQTLVANGFNLNFLNRREYGLDAIYNRYFEGGTKHGNR